MNRQRTPAQKKRSWSPGRLFTGRLGTRPTAKSASNRSYCPWSDGKELEPDLAKTAPDPRQLVAQGKTPAQAIQESRPLLADTHSLLSAWAELDTQLAGFGPQLAPLIQDPQITDILLNEPQQVWIDRGRGLEKRPFACANPAELRQLALRLAGACGKRLDDAAPIADGTLPGGVRLHAVLPPLSDPYPLISLRCPRALGITFAELVTAGTIHPRLAPLLQQAIHQRASTFISGATGSGKTTLLSALLELISPQQRIVCIEEVSELRPRHPHVVHLQERMSNVQGEGAIPMSQLVRAAMRMRPDRIVLGECRGAEVREVLSAMNTGHQGAWATVHANTVRDVPARLVALGALAQMSEHTVHAQVLSGVDLFLHVQRTLAQGRAKRWIAEVGLPVKKAGHLEVERALTISADGTLRPEAGWKRLTELLDLPDHLLDLPAHSSLSPLPAAQIFAHEQEPA